MDNNLLEEVTLLNIEVGAIVYRENAIKELVADA
jgi:hypothetical protein